MRLTIGFAEVSNLRDIDRLHFVAIKWPMDESVCHLIYKFATLTRVEVQNHGDV